MWLVVTTLAAAIVTAIWYAKDSGEYKLGFLSLMLWGTAIMVFVDHVMGYLAEGGEFIEMSLDAFVLSIAMVIVAVVAWEVVLLVTDPKGKLRKLKV